ncbi:uroporphyrinogen-III C-methyltransferase [Gilvimarinus sp. SDUM040013]|uniref:uroporphyrinogen-III C-methyltransferase n=1 Tax=Gilvimarinus gilvus TaxID=3058038 RepID=A0ABU4S2S5_9GAMM|nr:uroporphyrinogen-III C-methyltransferase [Gilvimarinus sp. SDUM040013]MDO3388654.1 uroporphyrinogen-III C-methyltransferase [Gilvimarinus sp. SDUM040013]MDX6849549.1 uroporphyrinogen-III C-methyltransferase [Gilvimarinus sp. SDUM040013]
MHNNCTQQPNTIVSLNGRPSRQPGKVLLVGAGPGDAELLTIKALKAIENADVIFFDQLVSEEIRALFPKNTPAIYVGKVKNHHSVAQADLNQMLVEHAKRGLNVCRIKGGDPFVFGRGGEELLTLRQAGCDAQVIPGITAASGCTTAADIPLTHRGVSQGCTLITGHGEKDLNLNWSALAQLNHTLVFYMGISKSEFIQNQLLNAGMKGSTPAAFIENGCRKNQRIVTTTVAELFNTAQQHAVQSPALIVVGEVVSMASQLQQVVNQHPTGQLESLSA